MVIVRLNFRDAADREHLGRVTSCLYTSAALAVFLAGAAAAVAISLGAAFLLSNEWHAGVVAFVVVTVIISVLAVVTLLGLWDSHPKRKESEAP